MTMNFQHFDSLENKNSENMGNLIKNIVPGLVVEEIKLITSETIKDSPPASTGIKQGSVDGFVLLNIPPAKSKINFDLLQATEQEAIYKTFISKESTSIAAIKWRFYQYLKICQDFELESIQMNMAGPVDNDVHFILKTKSGEVIFVLFYSILDQRNYEPGVEKAKALGEKILPDRVIFAAFKSHRTVPIEMSLKFGRRTIKPELWLEWYDDVPAFDADDAILINEDPGLINGYNFTNMNELLEYVYKIVPTGRVMVFRKEGILSGYQDAEKELIWKGLIIKN